MILDEPTAFPSPKFFSPKFDPTDLDFIVVGASTASHEVHLEGASGREETE